MATRSMIERTLRDIIKRDIKYLSMNRDIIGAIDTEGPYGKITKEILFYKNINLNRYFVSVDGTPVVTALSKNECARKAYEGGFISTSFYKSITK